MRPKWQLTLIAVVLALLGSWGVWYSLHRARGDQKIRGRADAIVAAYRRIVVLMDGAADLDPAVRARCRAAGRQIFWEKEQALQELTQALERSPGEIRQLTAYAE